jgi:hypothetical protein
VANTWNFVSYSHSRTRVKIEKINNLFQVDINRCEQGCAAHHEQYCQHVVTALFNWNNLEQHGWQFVHSWPHNIVHACRYQLGTTCAFLAVYSISISAFEVAFHQCISLHNAVVKPKEYGSRPGPRALSLSTVRTVKLLNGQGTQNVWALDLSDRKLQIKLEWGPFSLEIWETDQIFPLMQRQKFGSDRSGH